MKLYKLLVTFAGLAVITAALALGFVWTQCRVFVPSDHCLVLTRKTGAALPPGELVAGPGQRGVQREPLGPGRYFLNPWVWNWELHPLVTISAGDPATWREYYDAAGTDTAFPALKGEWPQVGLLVNRVGKAAPEGTEVVDVGYKGIQKAVLTPGTYRINPYVYDVKTVPAIVIPIGCCGVVTSQLGDMPEYETIEDVSIGPDGQPVKDRAKRILKLAEPGQRGVLHDILQPGIYYLNPYVHKVQTVQVGYNQISQDKSSELSTHITFPSKDGFTIDVEVTVVWGRHPAHVAEMINRFGEIEKLKEIIIGQMRSICRNLGSEYESTDFIRGEKRELYQQEVTETLRRVCAQRDIDVLIALIHNIAVHGGTVGAEPEMDLKKTIQRGYIAREQDLTKQAQRETAGVRATLETAKVAVDIARERISAETRKKVAELKAEGQKAAQEILAQRDLDVATIEKQIADLEAATTLLLGKAEADVLTLKNEADAQGKRLMIQAFGSGAAYNLYTFAENFAPESVRLIFAGEGTFWTDLTRLQDAASLELLKPDRKPQ